MSKVRLLGFLVLLAFFGMGCATKNKSILLMAGKNAEQTITANIWLEESIRGPIVYASAPKCGALPVTPSEMKELYESLMNEDD